MAAPGRFAAVLVAAAAIWAAGAAAALAQVAPPSFSACEQAVDEDALREVVTLSAQSAMAAAAEEIDHRRIVEDAWRAVNFDAQFERIVDAKIALLRADTNYLERLLDGNIPSRAEEMATRTADTVFNSDEFRTLQEELQNAIGAQLEVEASQAQLVAGGQAAECLGAFLRARYADTVAQAYRGFTERGRINADALGGTSAGFQATLSMAAIIASILTVVFRRVVRRIIAAVIRRLAGAIAARLAAMASVILGVAVILYELIAGADGVFPIIREELVSAQTRTEFQTTLIAGLQEVTPQELARQADAIAAQMIESWRQYKLDRRAVFDLAERFPAFKAFIGELDPARFEALVVAVNALRAEGGEPAILAAFDSGVLERAVNIPELSRHVQRLAPLGVRVADIVAWRDAAGARFDLALAADLPRVMRPEDLTPAELDGILALGEAEAVKRVAVMEPAARREALVMEREQLLKLTARFSGVEMSGLFASLRPAESNRARARYLDVILADPALISRLDGAGDAVAASANPGKALDILLSRAEAWNVFAVVPQVEAVVDGEVAPMVLVHRYGWALMIALGAPLLLGIIVLRWLGRLFGIGGRRRREQA